MRTFESAVIDDLGIHPRPAGMLVEEVGEIISLAEEKAAKLSASSWLKMRMVGSLKRTRPAETRTDNTRFTVIPKRK